MHMFSIMHWTRLCVLSSFILFNFGALGALYDRFEDLPTSTFDYLVVGAGPGGSVVANRLTEDPDVSVLLLEAGGSDKDLLDVIVPFFNFFTRLGAPNPIDWNYTCVPQIGLNNRTLNFTRGYVLGGSTSVNGMAFTRGSFEDYDRLARVSGDPGWSWNNMLKYMFKNEKWTPPVDHHNTTGEFNPAVHSFHGITGVSLAGFPQSIDKRVIQVTKELPEEFPFNLDVNSGRLLGIGFAQVTIENGQRSSASTLYLGPKFISRPNLHVLINARATRVIKTGTANGLPVFKILEFAQSRTGSRRRLTARREIILSGGSINTPQILLNSGIGDKRELATFGIRQLVDLPDVGKNLSVHTSVKLAYLVNSTDTYDDIVRNATLRDEQFELWNRTRQGPLADTLSSQFAYVRLPKNSSLLKDRQDPAAGPNTPHFQIDNENGIFGSSPPTGHFLALPVVLLTPMSRGSVKLNSTNPFDQPLTDFGSLTTDFDLAALREGVKTVFRYAAAPSWKDYIISLTGDIANATTDAVIEAFLRNNAAPNGHIVATSSMSPKNANYGVVDPDLRVKRTVGLRIVDASVMPFVPAANTQSAVYNIGERASDLIKASRGEGN